MLAIELREIANRVRDEASRLAVERQPTDRLLHIYGDVLALALRVEDADEATPDPAAVADALASARAVAWLITHPDEAQRFITDAQERITASLRVLRGDG